MSTYLRMLTRAELKPGTALCDGTGARLWVYADEAGMVTTLTERQFMIPMTDHIHDALVKAFKTEISRKLVEENPNLRSESLRSELNAEIETIFTRDHTVTVPPLDDD